MRHFILGPGSILLELMQATLAERGLIVSGAADTEAALAAASPGDVFIILDAHVPQQVLGTVREIRGAEKSLKIILIARHSVCSEISQNCAPLVDVVISDERPLDVILSAITLVSHSLSVGEMPGATGPPPATGANEPLPAAQDLQQDDCPNAVEAYRLSRREARILQLLSTGAQNKEIAKALGIAEATVKSHLRSSYLKIGCKNRTQAAMWSSRHLS